MNRKANSWKCVAGAMLGWFLMTPFYGKQTAPLSTWDREAYTYKTLEACQASIADYEKTDRAFDYVARLKTGHPAPTPSLEELHKFGFSGVTELIDRSHSACVSSDDPRLKNTSGVNHQ